MPSLQARLICFLLRSRQRLRRETIDWNTYEAVLRFRREVENGAGFFGKLPGGIEVSPVTIGGFTAEWILPSTVKDRVMLYFHGGGYVSGTCRAHRPIVSKFVNGSGVGALLFEYRLAPEHRFPAALEDSVAAYRWLLAEGVSPSKIVFVGDSAGGGLCLATLLALRDQGMPLPAAAAAYSPVTDYKCTGESYRTNAKLCLAPEGTAQAFAKHYAGESDPGLPYISPLYGDLHGLPPILIHVGGHETLRDDSIRFAEKAKAAGVDVTLRVGEGLFHCYPACSPLFPEARQAMDEICTFINKHTGGQI
ncbi:MAG: alpha/beta hydrolase [Bacillota bacterium]